jgi:hypothetical protein
MRIWDIVDSIYPGVPIVETRKISRRAQGVTSSAAQWVFAASLVIACASTFTVTRPCDSNYTQGVKVAADSFMTHEVAATLSAMRDSRFDAGVADLEPENEEPIGYSYPS